MVFLTQGGPKERSEKEHDDPKALGKGREGKRREGKGREGKGMVILSYNIQMMKLPIGWMIIWMYYKVFYYGTLCIHLRPL